MSTCWGAGRHPPVEGVKQCPACAKRAYERWYYGRNREAIAAARRLRQRNASRTNPKLRMLSAARQRAKKLGLPCTVRADDFVIPAKCPVLGIALTVGVGQPTDNSPSLDRLLPARGYVKGNIAVISFRANAIKNCASAAELRAVAAWLGKVTKS